MKKCAIMAAAFCLLAGCAASQRLGSSPWPQLPHDARAGIYCIFALDKNNVWVGGCFHDPAVTLYSTMYHTTDGGRSWYRVGPAIENSAIFTIFFLDEKTGWAAGAWTTESAGEPFVLRTTNGGITWTRAEVPVDPRPTPLFVPESIAFATPKTGFLQLSGTIVEHEQSVLISEDGGKSWTFSHGMKDEGGPRNTLSVTKQGVLWKVDENEDILMSTDDGLSWQGTKAHPAKASQAMQVAGEAGRP